MVVIMPVLKLILRILLFELSQTYKKDNGGTFYLYTFKGDKRFVPHLDHEHIDCKRRSF